MPSMGSSLLLGLSLALALVPQVKTFSAVPACLLGRRGGLQPSTPPRGPTPPRRTAAWMGLDVAPQVISAFPTAEEQNECLAVVNAAVKALQSSDKVIAFAPGAVPIQGHGQACRSYTGSSTRSANKELGKAGEVTYIMAAGRPRQGVISARFNCKFVKGATALRPGFVVPIFGKGGQSEEEAGAGGTGRGAQVAQVNVQAAGPEIIELIVDVDGGWGRRLLIKGNFGGATW